MQILILIFFIAFPVCAKQSFSSDKASIQRGVQVFKEVCSSCHGLRFVAFRNLKDIGLSEDQIISLASNYTIKDGPNETGAMFDRSCVPTDCFPSPYDNEQLARLANNGSLPPDLSLIAKARKNGVRYIKELLTGYKSNEPNKDGLYYNKAFEGGLVAMMPPLHDGIVQYYDKTNSSVEQMAHDVANFLAWAADPYKEKRESLGIKVMLFLSILSIVFWLLFQQIKRDY